MENSLCSNCKYTNDCSLTTNKNFIWSCSEHEIAAINNYDQEKRTTKMTFEYQTTERAIEMI